MLQWEQNRKPIENAKIVIAQGKEIWPKKVKLAKLYKGIEEIQDTAKKLEAYMLRASLESNGGRVILGENKDIHLYYSSDQFMQKTKCTITNNDELYSLLKDLVQF